VTEAENRRAAGLAKMEEIYGFSVDPDTVPGGYMDMMVDHLFGTVWTGEALGTKDRRLLTMGVLAALGQFDLIDLQFDSALRNGELTGDQVREAVLHLTQYIGWPLSTGVHRAAEQVIARRGAATGRPEGGA
jgi:4-carboxymuconolactone decarboxylase